MAMPAWVSEVGVAASVAIAVAAIWSEKLRGLFRPRLRLALLDEMGHLYRSHNVVSAGSQENPVTDLMKPGWCRAAFQALQQASMRSSRVSMTRLARKRRRSSCHSSSTGLSSGL